MGIMVNNSQIQFLKMTETPIPKLVSSLAVPTIISMLTSSIYNMADTFFVAKLGTSAAGAVGIVFSLMAVIQAVGFGLGMGSGSNISRLLGQQKNKDADMIASTGFFSAITFGLILTITGTIFINALMRKLGATETILPYARDYAKYILFGAPIMCASFVMNNILRSEGKAALSMVGITFGGILNIVLDPIFIFVFKLGISGAAIATLLSQCVSFSLLLSCFIKGKSTTKLRVKNVSKKIGTYFLIIKTGLPSLCRQALASIATIVLNVNAAFYGDSAVAAMSIVGRIFMFTMSAMIGLGQGFQPVVGYNYGARKYDRVKEAIFFTGKVGTFVMTSFAVLGFIFAENIMEFFRKEDMAVIAIGTFAIRAQCLALPVHPMIVVSNMTLQMVGKSWQGTFLSAARQGIFFIPVILILSQTIGLTGIQITQPIADVLNALCSIPFMVAFFKEITAKKIKF